MSTLGCHLLPRSRARLPLERPLSRTLTSNPCFFGPKKQARTPRKKKQKQGFPGKEGKNAHKKGKPQNEKRKENGKSKDWRVREFKGRRFALDGQNRTPSLGPLRTSDFLYVRPLGCPRFLNRNLAANFDLQLPSPKLSLEILSPI